MASSPNSKEILVTGGAGFIGSHFIKRNVYLDAKHRGVMFINLLGFASRVQSICPCMEPRTSFARTNKYHKKIRVEEFVVSNFEILYNKPSTPI